MRNPCRKAAAVFPRAKNACGFVAALRFALIFYVMLLGYIAQIAKTVVRSVAIDVINLTCGPRAGHVQPSKSMALVIFAVNRRNQVAFAGQTAGYTALFDACLFAAARKNPRVGAVVKHFFEPNLRKHFGSLTHPERA